MNDLQNILSGISVNKAGMALPLWLYSLVRETDDMQNYLDKYNTILTFYLNEK